jgi:hypothetical protein
MLSILPTQFSLHAIANAFGIGRAGKPLRLFLKR